MSSTQANKPIRFPTVRGSNLSRKKYLLPDDIEGDLALVMIAFRQSQQSEVDTWLPLAKRLSQQFDQLAYYELPTIDRLPGLARMFIDGGMRAGIPDLRARQATITLYLDKSAFRQELEISSEDTITTLLMDKEGKVLWRTQGPATVAAGQALTTLIADVLEQ